MQRDKQFELEPSRASVESPRRGSVLLFAVILLVGIALRIAWVTVWEPELARTFTLSRYQWLAGPLAVPAMGFGAGGLLGLVLGLRVAPERLLLGKVVAAVATVASLALALFWPAAAAGASLAAGLCGVGSSC